MGRIYPARRIAACFLGAGLVASLGACKVKDAGGGEPESKSAGGDTTLIGPSPTATASETPGTSIIRPDVADVPVVDTPAEPQNLTIAFPDGGYTLSARGTMTLRALMQTDAFTEGWPIVLRGHTDSEGDDAGNVFASRKRAEAVAGWLVEAGVDETRIEVIALGEQRPIAPNANLDGTPNEAGRRANRRVDIWVGEPGSLPPEPGASEADATSEARPPNKPQARGTPRPTSRP